MTEREKVIANVTAIVSDMQEEVDEWKDYSDSELSHGLTCDCDWWYKTLQTLKDAIALLKAQEPRVMTLRELAFYDAGFFVETRNGCPEGLTDELWAALVHLYCVSQNGENGYVSFVNWNADTYDFEAKDYNVMFRCWTSRPTDAQREATPWN